MLQREEGCEVACRKCGWGIRKSAGLSKESAAKASNLMRRPVQRKDRNATTSACVGWDELNIENQTTFRKAASNRKLAENCLLKRLEHHQNDGSDHQ